MVHGKYTVEAFLVQHPEKAVRRIRTKNVVVFVFHLPNGGFENFFLLFAEESILARMGIEAKNGDSRFVDTKIFFQTFKKNRDLLLHFCLCQ